MWIEADGLFVVFDSTIQISFGAARLGAIEVRFGHLRTQFDGFIEFSESAVRVALAEACDAALEIISGRAGILRVSRSHRQKDEKRKQGQGETSHKSLRELKGAVDGYSSHKMMGHILRLIRLLSQGVKRLIAGAFQTKRRGENRRQKAEDSRQKAESR